MRQRIKLKSDSRQKRLGKFVLAIGDDGAVLLHLNKDALLHRNFAANPEGEDARRMSARMQEFADTPVTLLFDTIDQTYIQQSLPPVAAMSVGKLIKRRLEREMSAEPIKGAYLIGRDKAGRKEWNFLLAGLQETPLVVQWLKRMMELPNRCLGLTLLPIEAELIAAQLRAGLAEKDVPDGEKAKKSRFARKHKKKDAQAGDAPKDARWQYIISNNRVSGLRQVILRDGKVIFTRLGQPPADEDMAVVAGSIEQETLGTLEYMKRLSLNTQEGLDVYIIAESGVMQLIDKNKFPKSNVYFLSPHDAARALGVGFATQESDRYGDVALAAFIGGHGKWKLKLFNSALERLDKLYRLAGMLKLLIVLAGTALLAYMGVLIWDIFHDYQGKGDTENQQDQFVRQLNTLKEAAKKAPEDLEVLNDTILLHETFTQEALAPMRLMNHVSNALPGDIRVTGIKWENAADAKAAPLPAAQTPVKLTLTVKFLHFSEPTPDFQQAAATLLKTLGDALPGYKVTYPSLPQPQGDKEKVEFSSDTEKEAKATAANQAAAALTTDILIANVSSAGDTHAPPQ